MIIIAFNAVNLHLIIHPKKMTENVKKNQQLLLMCCMLQKKIYPVYVSKHNSKRQEKVIILMFQENKKWHYLAVTKPSAISRRKTTNYGNFFLIVFVDLE